MFARLNSEIDANNYSLQRSVEQVAVLNIRLYPLDWGCFFLFTKMLKDVNE